MRQRLRALVATVLAGLGWRIGTGLGAFAAPAGYGRRARRGWSPRQVQRLAAKVRHRARHRRALRGRRA
ncbi:MAG: hypothetical protein QM617_04945 [Comamonas sp.]